jgi:hypothetical protein
MSDIAEDIRSAMGESSTDTSAPEPITIDVPSREVPDAPSGEDRQSTSGSTTQRDSTGRFAPKTPSQNNESVPENVQPAAQGVDANGNVQAVQNQQAQTALKAPISWKPEAREEWAKAPPAIQQEALRREREITDTLRTTAEARHFHTQFQQIVAPVEHMMRAENTSPLQAFQNLMQTAVVLRQGTPQQKAQLAVEIITQHGIDIEQLDNLLSARYSGRQAAPQNDVLALIDQRLQPFQQYLNTQQQQIQQAQQREMMALQEETTNFLNDPQFEFANDLAPDIADILELAANRGQKISLQDAYNRATMLHPTISGIIQRRNAGQNAANDSEAAIRARRAAASISDNGAPSRDSGNDDSEDIRSALTASMRSLNRR